MGFSTSNHCVGTHCNKFLLTLLVVVLTLTSFSSAKAQTLDPAFCDVVAGYDQPPTPGAQANQGVPDAGEIPAYTGGPGPMSSFTFDNAVYPEAVCNDGSPARMYVRKAPVTFGGAPNPNRNKWHMHLKGGGSCSSYEDCAERWCRQGDKKTNSPGLMSSINSVPVAKGVGIFKPDVSNRFASYNQILMFYCSSDRWIGDMDAGAAVSNHESDDPAINPNVKTSDITFKGAEIVDAAFTALEGAGGLTVPAVAGQPAFTLPLLEQADLFLLSGDSAGGQGARHHLDRLAARLRANNVPHGEELLVLGAFDAGASPNLLNRSIDWTALSTNYADYMQDTFDQAASFHGVTNGVLDASCIGITIPRSCFNTGLVQEQHIATQTFQRTSLEDVLTRNSMVGRGLVPDAATLRELTNKGLNHLLRPGKTPRANLSVMGPNCTKHVTYRSNTQFFNMKASATGPTVYEALNGFVTGCETGTCPTIVDIAPPEGRSICP